MRYLVLLTILISPFFVFAQSGIISEGTLQRAASLVTSLNQLGPKIDALKRIPPQSLTTLFQLTGIGVDAGYTFMFFGTVNPLDAPRDVTALFKNSTNSTATYFGTRGLSAPFSFAGGAYPGTGGTCGISIPPGTCTLVFRYAPHVADPGTKIGDVVRHLAWIYVSAVPAGSDFEEDSNTFSLTGYRRGETNEANATDELTAELQVKPDAILPGEIKSFLIRIGLKDGLDTRPIFFKNVTITGIAPPFFVEKNECAEQAINIGSCYLRLLFKPASSGIFQQNFSVSVNIGGDIYKQFSVPVSAQALLTADKVDANRNVLVVYNESWGESIEAKNYYLTERPRFAGINALGVRFPLSSSCTNLACLSEILESVPYPKIRDNVIAPIISWLQTHQDKNIQYIVFMRGLPTRTTDADIAQYGQGFSIQEMIRRAVAQTLSKEVFVSSVDMGSLEATKRYIDKLKTVYGLMPAKSVVISAQNTAVGGTTYYFSDAYAPNFEGLSTPAQDFVDALKAVRPSAQIVYKGFRDTALFSASNVSGLLHRGIYGYNWNSNYATDGSIQLQGNSGWYVAETVESFNGLWLAAGHQGNFIKWFSENAYGGTQYRNTPAAAVTYVLEPGSNGANGPSLFTCWDAGKPFAYCAWKSDRSGGRLQVVGDPLVTK